MCCLELGFAFRCRRKVRYIVMCLQSWSPRGLELLLSEPCCGLAHELLSFERSDLDLL